MIIQIILTLILLTILKISLNKKERFDNQNKYNIFLYWENKKNTKRHKYLDLCYNTIKKKNNNVIILTPKNIYNYIPKHKINKKVWDLKLIEQRADYIRFAVLNHNGGMWLDFDTICLKNLNFLFNYLKEYDMVLHSEQFFACNKGVLNNVMKELDNKLNNSKDLNFDYTELGLVTLKKNINNLKIYRIKSKNMIPKIDYSGKYWRLMFNNIKSKDFLHDDLYIVKLYNHVYKNRKDELVNNKNNLFNNILIEINKTI